MFDGNGAVRCAEVGNGEFAIRYLLAIIMRANVIC